jgi:hypothetical protein
MTAKAAAKGSSPSRATAAFSAHTAQRCARPCKKAKDVAQIEVSALGQFLLRL